MTSLLKLNRPRRKTISSTGRVVFLVFLILGSALGLWLGDAGARQVKRRNALRTAASAALIANGLDRAFGERYRALQLLAPMADDATMARFRKIYPEVVSIVRRPVRPPKGFHLSAGSLVATLGRDWAKPWLTGRKGDRIGLVSLETPPWEGLATFGGDRRQGGQMTTELRWRNGRRYQTSIERLRYPTAHEGDLVVAVATSNRLLAAQAARLRVNGLISGLILGLVPGAAAWFGIGRSTRRLRKLNASLERRVSQRTAELEAAERSFRGIFENAPMGLYQCDADGRFIRVNPNLAQSLGFDNAEVLIAMLGSIQRLGESSRRSAFMAELLSNGEAEMTSLVSTADGRRIWLSESARTIEDSNGVIRQIEGAVHDVTTQRALEDQLRKIGATDPLTGLLNRRGLEEALALAPVPVSVVVLDLDRFKTFNDTYGHPAGDRALQAVAKSLKSVLRDDAIVARIGGEEFVVCLPGLASPEAAAVVDRLRQAVASCDALESRLTVSAGVATAASRAELDLAFAEADRALYQAKEAGRNKIVFR